MSYASNHIPLSGSVGDAHRAVCDAMNAALELIHAFWNLKGDEQVSKREAARLKGHIQQELQPKLRARCESASAALKGSLPPFIAVAHDRTLPQFGPLRERLQKWISDDELAIYDQNHRAAYGPPFEVVTCVHAATLEVCWSVWYRAIDLADGDGLAVISPWANESDRWLALLHVEAVAAAEHEKLAAPLGLQVKSIEPTAALPDDMVYYEIDFDLSASQSRGEPDEELKSALAALGENPDDFHPPSHFENLYRIGSSNLREKNASLTDRGQPPIRVRQIRSNLNHWHTGDVAQHFRDRFISEATKKRKSEVSALASAKRAG